MTFTHVPRIHDDPDGISDAEYDRLAALRRRTCWTYCIWATITPAGRSGFAAVQVPLVEATDRPNEANRWLFARWLHDRKGLSE